MKMTAAVFHSMESMPRIPWSPEMTMASHIPLKTSHIVVSSEFSRMRTFKTWPSESPVRPNALARQGFQYTGSGDEIVCTSCKLHLSNLENADSVAARHKTQKPQCSFVQNQGDSPMQDLTTSVKGLCFFDRSTTFPGKPQLDHPGQGADNINPGERSLSTSTPSISINSPVVLVPHEPDSGICRNEVTGHNGKQNCSSSQKFTRKTIGTVKRRTIIKPYNTEAERKQLEQRIKEIQDQRLCRVCMDEQFNTVFLPCGHLVCCSSCSAALRSCPICRTYIRGTVRTYWA